MKTKKIIKITAPLILVAAAVLACFAARVRAQEKTYVFMVPTLIDLADTSFGKMISDITVAVSQKSGINLKMVRPVYDHGGNATEIVLKAMKENKAQMGYVNGLEYADLMGKYPKLFRPEFTITFDGKKNKEDCIYVAKNSPVTDIKGTKGLVWGGEGEEIYKTRLILHENGFDGPLSSYFKQAKFVKTSPVSMLVEALLKGDIEVFTTEKAYLNMSGGMVGGDKSKQVSASSAVKEISCTLYDNNWIFGYRFDVPQDVSKKITQIMVNAHKDQAFKNFQFMYIAIKGHFVPFTDQDLARSIEIKKLKDKYGWEKEYIEQNKKYKH
jgi:hypothetical protein